VHLPERRCRICRTTRLKSDLQRWVWQDGELVSDLKQNLPGRGLYSCPGECSDKLEQHKERFTK
jgi:predicted RNA-binding protein YlxR (DUF448 family)